MLFNSYEFLFGFLPLTLFAFFVVGRYNAVAAAATLALASLCFYAWWDARYVMLLILSMSVNYTAGVLTARANAKDQRRVAFAATSAGIAVDLALLGYYKYANFFLGNYNELSGSHISIGAVVLPLGISFFTFTQIAFLVDTYRRIAREYNPVHFALFVTYFPHLIAGPILHHKEMMPQFERAANYRPHAENFAVGLTIFSIGLAKKTLLADGIGPFANAVFVSAAAGDAPTLLYAWGGAIAYTLQLYFDFSGYSDMAIGLARLFGITFPLNFNSPYKATNIIEFWRRWHMTLSRFLRDYLYLPLGGNRHGTGRRYVNLMTVMLLGGLWHGAGWTFVFWGGLHGVYLVVNHAWQAACRSAGIALHGRVWHGTAVTITFVAVVFGWVFFRAASFETAIAITRGMLGLNGASIPMAIVSAAGPAAAGLERLGVQFTLGGGAQFVKMYAFIIALMPIVFFAPNTQQLLRRYRPGLDFVPTEPSSAIQWSPTRRWAVAIAALGALGLLSITRHSEFLYFQF